MTNLQLFNKTYNKLPRILFEKVLENTENEVVKCLNKAESMLFEDLEFISTNKHNTTSQKETTKIGLYHKDRVKGGKKRHATTDIVKYQIVQPLFFNPKITGKYSVHNKANNIANMLGKIALKSDKDLLDFAQKYELSYDALKVSTFYLQQDKRDSIYRWCLKFDKERQCKNQY